MKLMVPASERKSGGSLKRERDRNHKLKAIKEVFCGLKKELHSLKIGTEYSLFNANVKLFGAISDKLNQACSLAQNRETLDQSKLAQLQSHVADLRTGFLLSRREILSFFPGTQKLCKVLLLQNLQSFLRNYIKQASDQTGEDIAKTLTAYKNETDSLVEKIDIALRKDGWNKQEMAKTIHIQGLRCENLLLERDNLKSDIDNLKRENEELSRAWEGLLSAKDRSNSEREYFKSEMNRLRCENGKVKSENAHLESENAKTRFENARLEFEINKAKTKTALLESEIGRIKFDNARLEYEYNKRESENTRLESENARLKFEDARLESENTRLESENARLESENTRLESENARLESENTRLIPENARLESENARLESENTRLESENTNLESENACLKSKNARLEPENACLKSENTSLESENTRLESENTNLRSENANLKSEEQYFNKESQNSASEKEFSKLEKEKAEFEIKSLRLENDQLRLENDNLKTESSELKVKINRFDTAATDVGFDKEALETERSALRAEKNDLELENKQLKTEICDLKVEKGNLEWENTEMKTDKDSLNSEILSLKSEKRDFECEKENLVSENSNLTIKNKNLLSVKSKLISKLKESNKFIRNLSLELKDVKIEYSDLKSYMKDTILSVIRSEDLQKERLANYLQRIHHNCNGILEHLCEDSSGNPEDTQKSICDSLAKCKRLLQEGKFAINSKLKEQNKQLKLINQSFQTSINPEIDYLKKSAQDMKSEVILLKSTHTSIDKTKINYISNQIKQLKSSLSNLKQEYKNFNLVDYQKAIIEIQQSRQHWINKFFNLKGQVGQIFINPVKNSLKEMKDDLKRSGMSRHSFRETKKTISSRSKSTGKTFTLNKMNQELSQLKHLLKNTKLGIVKMNHFSVNVISSVLKVNSEAKMLLKDTRFYVVKDIQHFKEQFEIIKGKLIQQTKKNKELTPSKPLFDIIRHPITDNGVQRSLNVELGSQNSLNTKQDDSDNPTHQLQTKTTKDRLTKGFIDQEFNDLKCYAKKETNEIRRELNAFHYDFNAFKITLFNSIKPC